MVIVYVINRTREGGGNHGCDLVTNERKDMKLHIDK